MCSPRPPASRLCKSTETKPTSTLVLSRADAKDVVECQARGRTTSCRLSFTGPNIFIFIFGRGLLDAIKSRLYRHRGQQARDRTRQALPR